MIKITNTSPHLYFPLSLFFFFSEVRMNTFPHEDAAENLQGLLRSRNVLQRKLTLCISATEQTDNEIERTLERIAEKKLTVGKLENSVHKLDHDAPKMPNYKEIAPNLLLIREGQLKSLREKKIQIEEETELYRTAIQHLLSTLKLRDSQVFSQEFPLSPREIFELSERLAFRSKAGAK